MKKLRAVVVVAAIAALAIGLLAGCSCSSGGSSKTQNFGWYEAVIPAGYEDVNESGNKGQEFDKKVDGKTQDEIIKAYMNSTSSKKPDAAAAKADRIAMSPDRYTDKGQMKIGNYTWEVVGFQHNSKPSLMLFTQDPSDTKNIIQLDFFCMDENNADMKTFAESFKYLGEKEEKK